MVIATRPQASSNLLTVAECVPPAGSIIEIVTSIVSQQLVEELSAETNQLKLRFQVVRRSIETGSSLPCLIARKVAQL